MLQNDAARTILGAPGFARVENLLKEANLTPLKLRASELAVNCLARIIQSPIESELRKKIYQHLAYAPGVFLQNPWLAQVAAVIDEFKLRATLLDKSMDSFHPDFRQLPPWENPSEFSVMKTNGAKRLCNPTELKRMTEEVIQRITPPQSATYLTDGSLDPLTHTAGAAFVIDGVSRGVRTSDSTPPFSQPTRLDILGTIAQILRILEDTRDACHYTLCHRLWRR